MGVCVRVYLLKPLQIKVFLLYFNILLLYNIYLSLLFLSIPGVFN